MMGFKIKKTVNGETVWQPIKAKKYTTSKITEYTGTLPITITADGNALLDYRIYGADWGVGEPTENLFDKNANDIQNGKVLQPDGTSPPVTGQEYYSTTGYIEIPNNTTNLTLVKNSPSNVSGICFYDTNKEYISGISNKSNTIPAVISCPTGAVYFRTVISKTYIDEAMVVPGSTAPTSYIPYGYKLPMTVQSANLFDKNAPRATNQYLNASGSLSPATNNISTTDFIKINSSTVYTITATGSIRCKEFDDAQNPIRTNAVNDFDINANSGGTFTSSANAAYLRFSIQPNYIDTLMLTSGSTAPATYIPYNKQTTPVYIGENQLDAGEYVSYGEQKIYRDVSGTLTPTDPPVPLPEIPTIKGETVIDYDGEPKPSQMYIKYNSWSGWSNIDNYKMVNGNWTQEVT